MHTPSLFHAHPPPGNHSQKKSLSEVFEDKYHAFVKFKGLSWYSWTFVRCDKDAEHFAACVKLPALFSSRLIEDLSSRGLLISSFYPEPCHLYLFLGHRSPFIGGTNLTGSWFGGSLVALHNLFWVFCDWGYQLVS